MTVVIDASAAVMPVFRGVEDPRGPTALALRPHLAARYGFAAPSLIAWEIGRVVHNRYPALFGKSATQRGSVVRSILTEIELVPPGTQGLQQTGTLAERRGLTFYDAAYLELASRDDVSILLTDDKGLLRAGEAFLGPGRAYDTPGAHEAVARGEL